MLQPFNCLDDCPHCIVLILLLSCFKASYLQRALVKELFCNEKWPGPPDISALPLFPVFFLCEYGKVTSLGLVLVGTVELYNLN